tara:strand:- start:46 stop:417 length:372 start_codon:yes stop_codon:yes gene_type:complete
MKTTEEVVVEHKADSGTVPHGEDEVITYIVCAQHDGTTRTYINAHCYGVVVNEGWVQYKVKPSTHLCHIITLLRDNRSRNPSESNGYYVQFSNDPTGERGTGGYDPETGKGPPDIEMIIWRAP